MTFQTRFGNTTAMAVGSLSLCPKNLSKEIRENHQWQEEGWGRMKAISIVKGFEWNTAIWFDKKLNTYLFPLKAEIRKKASLKIDDRIIVSISI